MRAVQDERLAARDTHLGSRVSGNKHVERSCPARRRDVGENGLSPTSTANDELCQLSPKALLMDRFADDSTVPVQELFARIVEQPKSLSLR